MIECLDAIGERDLAGAVKAHVDHVSLSGGNDDARRPYLTLELARIRRDDLHSRVAEGKVVDPRVRDISEVKAHNIAAPYAQRVARLAIDEEGVTPSAHENVRRCLRAVRQQPFLVDEKVVQSEHFLAVHRWQPSFVRRHDENVAVKTEVLLDV